MKPLTFATVCSGVECMSVAALGLPLKPVFFSEIEPYPCAVLKAHYPHVPNLGDMSRITIKEGIASNGRTDVSIPGGQLDILAGGTPCQDVSVAGLRRGMQEGSGTRSSLAWHFVRLVREARPRFVLWENVDGVRSDPSFPGFLRAIGDCGYSVAYRVFDAQFVRCEPYHHPDYAHAGVDGMGRAIPQRRRRVWVVGCLGTDYLSSARILFEHDCMLGDHPPRRRTRQEARLVAGERAGVHDRVVGALQNNLIGRVAGGPQGPGIRTDGAAFTIDTTVGGGGVAIERAEGVSFDVNMSCPVVDEVAHTQKFGTSPGHKNGVLIENEINNCTDDDIARMRYIVRRLTPTECERLSGLPDWYTVPRMQVTDAVVSEFVGVWNEWRRITAPDTKPKTAKQVRTWLEKIANAETCPDAPRYKACGNGWATNQPRWILMRMMAAVDPDWMLDDGIEECYIQSFGENVRGEVRLCGNVSTCVVNGGGKPGQGYPAVIQRKAE